MVRIQGGCFWRTVARWNTIYPDLVATAEKLRKLGFVYYNGKISIGNELKEGEHV